MLTCSPSTHRPQGHPGREKPGTPASLNSAHRVACASGTLQTYFTLTSRSCPHDKVLTFQYVVNSTRKVPSQRFLNGWLTSHKAQHWPEDSAHGGAPCSLRSKHRPGLSLGLGPRHSPIKVCPEPCWGHKTWQPLGSGRGQTWALTWQREGGGGTGSLLGHLVAVWP